MAEWSIAAVLSSRSACVAQRSKKTVEGHTALRKKQRNSLRKLKKRYNFASQRPGEMAEWSIAAVLKTVEGNTSGGSNPSLSAKAARKAAFFVRERNENPRVRNRAALA